MQVQIQAGGRGAAEQRADDGHPTLIVSGRAQLRAEELGVSHWHITLSHTDAMASAVVVAERS